ncbi:alpha/beta hydrolase-fold protein [Paucibacter sp. APW11]|uniref:Alpha/beta hydrolase-fold protein n=1 Tax=Roseateles aquae TaxID=3077235 RepID=A0ABU3PE89_9BURK|nr:alpha/beta hydrolase-fold protein [Paucibacter sp. APW11]MDT9000854.1 alpha/beta hydrolase-fold protein [Paucibacter sp. APW11]
MNFRNLAKSLLILLTLLALLYASRSLEAAALPSAPAYELPQTEVHALHAARLGRDYQLFVGLPEGYAEHPERRYPLLLLADGPYAFPLMRSITRRVSDHGRALQDHIVVGLSYSLGDSPALSRNRDYTPAPRRDARAGELYGEGPAYARHLREEVLPYLASHFRVDMNHKTFMGHSYGALLGAQMLLNTPSAFERYVLSSASLWYGDGLLLRRAEQLVREHAALPAQVLLLAGALERPRRSGQREQGDDIAGDTLRFEALLKRAKLPGLTISAQILPEEDHLSAAPVAYTRGLRWALPR